jgi:hypothetical protein
VPTNAFRLNRIEAQFTALSFFALDGTGHSSHGEQASMIRRSIGAGPARGPGPLGRDQPAEEADVLP